MLARLLTAAALVAATAVTPTYAEDIQKGVNLGADYAGSITVAVTSDLEWTPGYLLSSTCAYVGVLTPNNRLIVVTGGVAVAVGPQLVQLTFISCSVSNQDGQSDMTQFANGGPVSLTAKTTAPWRVSPILVCVEGFAVYGPTPVRIITMVKQCNTIIA